MLYIKHLKTEINTNGILKRVFNVCYIGYLTNVKEPIQQKLKDNNITNNIINNITNIKRRRIRIYHFRKYTYTPKNGEGIRQKAEDNNTLINNTSNNTNI